MLFWESCLSFFWNYDKLRNAECKSKCIDINWNFWWWKRENFVLPAEFLHLFNAGILASFISFHWSDICTMFCVSFYPIICPKKNTCIQRSKSLPLLQRIDISMVNRSVVEQENRPWWLLSDMRNLPLA